MRLCSNGLIVMSSFRPLKPLLVCHIGRRPERWGATILTSPPHGCLPPTSQRGAPGNGRICRPPPRKCPCSPPWLSRKRRRSSPPNPPHPPSHLGEEEGGGGDPPPR